MMVVRYLIVFHMLKLIAWSLPACATIFDVITAIRARMAPHPRMGAVCMGVCAGLLNLCICLPLAVLAQSLFSSDQLGGSSATSLEGAGAAKLFWSAVVLAPLIETVIGQWLPIEVLRRHGVRATYCLLGSAALFSVLHVLGGAGMLQGVTTFIGGLAFAASYLLARNLGPGPAWLAAAAAHACSNGLLLFVIDRLLPLP